MAEAEKENWTLAVGDRVIDTKTNIVYQVSALDGPTLWSDYIPSVELRPVKDDNTLGNIKTVRGYESQLAAGNLKKIDADTSSSDNTSEVTSSNAQSEDSTSDISISSSDTSASDFDTSVSNGEVEDANNHQDVSQIPYDEAIGIVEDFNGLISAFSGIPKVSANTGFMKLKEAGLEAGFSEKFDGGVEAIISSAQSLSSALQSQIEECRVADLETEKSIPDSPPYKRNSSRYSGGASSNSSENDNNTSINLVDNADKQLNAYENMSMSDLREVLSTLVSTANSCGADLTALINDSKYSDKIKEALLNNVNINKNLKDLYEVADPNVTQKLLNSIVNGSQGKVVGLNTETILAMKKYLSMIANDNGITFDELIGNQEYSEKVKAALKDFGAVSSYVSQIKEENLQESFGNIYDGNSVGDQNAGVINSIRSYISAVSDNNNVPSEELLFNKNNDDLLKNGVNNLCRSSIYADTISYCNSSNILGILNILLKK